MQVDWVSCISSGLSRSMAVASFFHSSKTGSRKRPFRAAASTEGRSSLLSRVLRVLAEVRDWMADEAPELFSPRPGGEEEGWFRLAGAMSRAAVAEER